MNKKIIKWSLCVIVGLLVVMGLCFAWRLPSECIDGNGKWLDKTLSGIVSWTVFAPLVIFPIAGVVRQHRLIRDVENALTSFFSSQKDVDCIDLVF